MTITIQKLKVLNALKGGPQSHKILRLAYFGEERCKNPSNTAFFNQLGRMMNEGLITKKYIGVYEITEKGKEATI